MKRNKKAWVVSVNMGYGHQRSAYPLRDFAYKGEIINANDYKGIPEKDKKIWESSRGFYEFVSRFKRIPLIGSFIFNTYNKFQTIPSFYPRRDLSRPTFGLKTMYSLMDKGWGKHLIEELSKKPMPLISTFFTTAFMAEQFGYPGDIYTVVCDADISRAWVALKPHESRIKYLAPNNWTVNRLQLYGVKKSNIFLTGFPLPTENIGPNRRMSVLKKDIAHRLLNLDPKKEYIDNYKVLIKGSLGKLPKKSNHKLSIMFAVGGAGAQKEIAIRAVKSLKSYIKKNEIKFVLVAGIRPEVKEYFDDNLKEIGLENKVEIIFDKDIQKYFYKFNERLRTTDALWTKPSELSFYTGLGIPIIMAPAIGSQEDFNRRWLLSLGSGTWQENPDYIHQWFFDYLNSGRLAEAAMQGFVEAEKLGTYNIEKICFG